MPEPYGRIYLAVAALLTLGAATAMFRLRPRPALFGRTYWRWLLRPWKLVTFAIATAGMILVAPVSGDPTWDEIDGGVQSVLTFLTAPWAIATFYRLLRKRELARGVNSPTVALPARVEAFGAAVAWMLSASWFYDAYLYFRDGRYVDIWAENLFASSALYLLAGLLWSIEADRARKIWFAFQIPEWPAVPDVPFRRVAVLALVIMGFTTFLMLPFLVAAWSALAE